MTLTDADPCRSCGGRGWLYLTHRRLHEVAGGCAENRPHKRGRVTCLACLGTGIHLAGWPASEESDADGDRDGHDQLSGSGRRARSAR